MALPGWVGQWADWWRNRGGPEPTPPPTPQLPPVMGEVRGPTLRDRVLELARNVPTFGLAAPTLTQQGVNVPWGGAERSAQAQAAQAAEALRLAAAGPEPTVRAPYTATPWTVTAETRITEPTKAGTFAGVEAGEPEAYVPGYPRAKPWEVVDPGTLPARLIHEGMAAVGIPVSGGRDAWRRWDADLEGWLRQQEREGGPGGMAAGWAGDVVQFGRALGDAVEDPLAVVLEVAEDPGKAWKGLKAELGKVPEVESVRRALQQIEESKEALMEAAWGGFKAGLGVEKLETESVRRALRQIEESKGILTAAMGEWQVPGVLERIGAGARKLWSGGMPEYETALGTLPLLFDPQAWGQALEQIQATGFAETKEALEVALGQMLGHVLDLPGAAWQDLKQIPVTGWGTRQAEKLLSNALTVLQVPAWWVKEWYGTEIGQRLPGSQGLWPLVDPAKHLTPDGQAKVEDLVEAWWSDYYVESFRSTYGKDPPQWLRSVAEPVQRYVITQMVLLDERGSRESVRDHVEGKLGKGDEAERLLGQLAVGMGYSSYEAQIKGADRLAAGEDLETVVGGRRVNVADPSEEDVAAYQAYIEGIRANYGEDAAAAAAAQVQETGYIPGESDIGNEFLFEFGLDPLNCFDVFEWMGGIKKLGRWRQARRFTEAADTAADVARWADTADDAADAARIVTANADEAAALLGKSDEVTGGWRALWKKINPLAPTPRAQAERMADTAFQVLTPGVMEVADGDEARALVRAMAEDPQALTGALGGVPVSKAADQARPLITGLVDDLDDVKKFPSLAGEWDATKFLDDASGALLARAQDVTGVGAVELSGYEKFAGGFRDFMSKFYLRTPGYAMRNAAGDYMTMAWDGLLSFDGRGKIDDFFKRFGGTTRRVGGTVAGGSQVLTKGEDWFGARWAEKLTGGLGAWIGKQEEGRYLRAFYTSLTRDTLPKVWNADAIKTMMAGADLGLSPQQMDNLAHLMARGVSGDEFVDAVKVVAGGDTVVDVGRWVDDPDVLSVGLRLQIETALARGDDVDEVLDGARVTVASDTAAALAKDPTPPGRRVWSDFEAAQDAAEDQGWLDEMGKALGLDDAELAKAKDELAKVAGETERAVREAEGAVIEAVGGVDPADAGVVVRTARADTAKVKMNARAAADQLRAEAWRRVAEGEDAKLVWPWYFGEVRKVRETEQAEIVTRLGDTAKQLDLLTSGQKLEDVLGGPVDDIVETALDQLRSSYADIAARQKRVQRLGLEEFLDFDSKLDMQRLAQDVAEQEAWRMFKMNPSRDGLDILMSTQEGIDRLARATVDEVGLARSMMINGKMGADKFHELADSAWRKFFVDATSGWSLAQWEVSQLPLDQAGQMRALGALGWPVEQTGQLSPDMVRAVLGQGVRWDSLLDAPAMAMDDIMRGSLTEVAGRVGLDLSYSADWTPEEWRAVADAAEKLAKEAGDKGSVAARLTAARAEVAAEAAAAAAVPRTVYQGMDLVYPASADDVARSMGRVPQQLDADGWAEVAQYCQDRANAALLMGDPYGRRSLAAQEALRLPELGAVGGQDVTMRVGRLSARQEAGVVAELGKEARTQADQALDWLLTRAGYDADEVADLSFTQKKKLTAELAEGTLTRTKGGRASAIGQVAPQTRQQVLHGLSDEVKELALGMSAEPETALGYRWAELADVADGRAAGEAAVVTEAPGLYDAAGFPVARDPTRRPMASLKAAVDKATEVIPEAEQLGRGRATVGFEARQAFLAERYADLRDMARARAGLLEDGVALGGDVLDVPDGVVKLATEKEGGLYLLRMVDGEDRVLKTLAFENYGDVKTAKQQALDLIEGGLQGRAADYGTRWHQWGTTEVATADARAAALGGYADPPTLADVSRVMEDAQLDALEKIREGVKAEGLTSAGAVDPVVRQRLLDWAGGDLARAWSEARTQAVDVARASADFALLDYAGGRRNIDNWLNLICPYTYWKTRSARNWVVRFAQNPGALNAWTRYKEMMERVDMERGYRARFAGMWEIPVGDLLPEWMGESVFFDPTIIMPWSQALGVGWAPGGEPKNPVDQLYRMGQTIGLRPYGFIEWGLKYMDLIGEGREDIGYWLPHTGAIQGLTALAGVGGPGGVNIEAPIRRALGLPETEPWGEYRVSRMLSNMAADDPTLTDQALLAQELVRLVEAGELTYEEALQGGGNLARLAQAQGWTEEEVLAAQGLLAEAMKRAAQERGVGAVTSFLGGAGLKIYPEGERTQVGLSAEEKAQKWSPLTGLGSREAWKAWKEAHPEAATRGVVSSAAEGGEYTGWTPAQVLAMKKYQAAVDEINRTYDEAVDAALREEPWNKNAVAELEEERRAELDVLRDEYAGLLPEREEGYTPPSTYAASPEEKEQIYREAVLAAVSAAMPKVDEFRDPETGEVNYEGYSAAVEAFYADLPGAMAGDERLAAIAEEMGEGVRIPVPGAAGAVAKAGGPAGGIREERLVTMEELLAGVDQEAVSEYWRRNDSELEALARVWEETVYRDAWAQYRTAVDGGMDKGKAYAAYIEPLGEVEAADLIGEVMEAYPGRWTEEELRAAYAGVTFPSVEDVGRLRLPEEERELEDAKAGFWDYYNTQLPPGWRSADAREYYLIQTIMDAELRGTVTAEQYAAAAAWLEKWRGENYDAEDWREEEWDRARTQNRKFLDTVAKDWPDVDFGELQDQYFAIEDKAGRRAFLEEHPELEEYWDFRKEWGRQHPIWAYFYLRQGTEQAQGERRWYGGGRRWKPRNYFLENMAEDVPRFTLQAPSPWKGALKLEPYRARGTPWVLERRGGRWY